MTETNQRNIYDKISKATVFKKLEEIFGAKNVTDKTVDLYPYSYDMTEC